MYDFDNLIRSIRLAEGITIDDFLYEENVKPRTFPWFELGCGATGREKYSYKNNADFVDFFRKKGKILVDPFLDSLPIGKTYNYVIVRDRGSGKFHIIFAEGWIKSEIAIKHDMLAAGNDLYFAGELRVDGDGRYTFNFWTSGLRVSVRLVEKYNEAYPRDKIGPACFVVQGGAISGNISDPCTMKIFNAAHVRFMRLLLGKLLTKEKQKGVVFDFKHEGIHAHYKSAIEPCPTDGELKELSDYARARHNPELCVDLGSNFEGSVGKYLVKTGEDVYKCKDGAPSAIVHIPGVPDAALAAVGPPEAFDIDYEMGFLEMYRNRLDFELTLLRKQLKAIQTKESEIGRIASEDLAERIVYIRAHSLGETEIEHAKRVVDRIKGKKLGEIDKLKRVLMEEEKKSVGLIGRIERNVGLLDMIKRNERDVGREFELEKLRQETNGLKEEAGMETRRVEELLDEIGGRILEVGNYSGGGVNFRVYKFKTI
ncbi:MAG: hypothetical protein Hyperionvirus23_29 [Hyperionvirus sp.]|uniref:Uncharacterized protein n=1 Tax=Hyperionvirus sp. TaxID=2487770 RepID=A0A3G5AB55_9VIRU|nr:MAG: hypothetical protein Hyperionvirus23_29 [Hyperionvirus sp.]